MTDCAARSWRAALGFSCCELCSLHVCAEDPPTKKEETSFQEEDEKGEIKARYLCTWRVVVSARLFSYVLYSCASLGGTNKFFHFSD